MSSGWITYKGKSIYYQDKSSIKDVQEAIRDMDAFVDLLKKSPTKILTLVNASGSITSQKEWTDHIANISKTGIFKDRIEKQALFGFDGIRLVYYKDYQLKSGDHSAQAFSTKEEALEWLVS